MCINRLSHPRLVANAIPSARLVLSAPATCQLRPFSLSPSLRKKRGKTPAPQQQQDDDGGAVESHQHRRKGGNSASADTNTDAAGTIDPLDVTPVLEAFAPMDAHFRTQLQAFTQGGRFNPSHLGALTVTVKLTGVPSTDGSGASHNEVRDFPLSELAQVVPRSGGRTVSLLVNDRAYIKPIMSAVQSSPDFNQQPQRSDENELELLLKVEAERKEDVVKRVKETTQTWRDRVRAARAKHEKTIKGWQKSKAITGDVAKKADKELQKVQDKKMKEIDDEEARIIKALGRN